MYCKLCLLYCIFCAVLHSIDVVQELFKSSIVCLITSLFAAALYSTVLEKNAVEFAVAYVNLYVAILSVSRYLHYCQHSVVMCVSPVSYLYYCQHSMVCKLVLCYMHVCLHYCQGSVLCMRVLYCVCTTASTVCYMCKSCVVFA